jgi:hypothetical protein|tara:strand:+ start:7649 stop:7795 length:147 start_codon:yes stop_codon:yes gene_type:complete
MGLASDAGNLGGTFVGAMTFVVFAMATYQITNRFGNDIVDAVRGRLRV